MSLERHVVTAERDWRALADDVGASLSQQLVRSAHGRITIDSVMWYGAVEVDTKHLVVWLLLGGADDHELPARFSPADGEWSADPQQTDLDPGLLTWMRRLRDEVREALAARG